LLTFVPRAANDRFAPLIAVNEMLPVLVASKGLRSCPMRCEEAGIYLKEPTGFLVSFGELTELRHARGKDALCR
jgi:hypothetical protein